MALAIRQPDISLYPGDSTLPKYIIATDLSDETVKARFETDIEKIRDYLIVPMYYAETVKIYEANEDKHKKRMIRRETHMFAYGEYDERIEELQSLASDNYETCGDILESICNEETRKEEHDKLIRALEKLSDKQRDRLMEYVREGENYKTIAKRYGVNPSSVGRTIKLAIETIRRIWDEG